MRVTIDLKKSVEENAGVYFENAKKLKKRIMGAKDALANSLKELEKLNSKRIKDADSAKTFAARQAKKEWYEKFRWFISSGGFLVVGGRDATTNEIIIKKHSEKGDIVFHTDIAGSPFFVVKAEGKAVGEATLREAADATCSFSRAFKLGFSGTPVFYASPEQFTKEAPTGEYLTKGSFVTKGKTTYIENKINIAIGITKELRVMAGPVEAVKANCEKFVEIAQGSDKTSSIAKFIQKKIGGEIDEIIRALPSGGSRIKK